VLYDKSNYLIFFGDNKHNVKTSEYPLEARLEVVIPKVQKQLNTKSMVFLRQTHETNGVIISKDYKLKYPIDIPTVSGDILVTDLEDVGIGVLTADCLPIVFYDNQRHVIAIAHAGWKGTVAGVAKKTLSMMQERFDCNLDNIEVHLGPAAKPCCYEVKADFLNSLQAEKINQSLCVISKEGRHFFDLSALNKMQLVEKGINQNNISEVYNNCTICNSNYCSYRREQNAANRQMTIAMLRKKVD